MKEKLINFMRMPISLKVITLKRVFYCCFNRRRFGKLGRGSYIRKPIMLTNSRRMYIGDYVDIGFGARIECITGWNQKIYRPKLEIGSRTSIGQNCHITCANHVVIEDDVTCADMVMITDIHHAHDLIDVHCFQQDLEVQDTCIRQYAFEGSGAVIMPGVTVGKNAVIGARAVVTKTVPDDCMAVGIPAKVIKKYNRRRSCWERV